MKGLILIILFLISLTSLPTKSHASQQESLLQDITYQNGKFIPTHLLDNSQSTVLYKGQQIVPTDIPPMTTSTMEDYLVWYHNRWSPNKISTFEEYCALNSADGTVEGFYQELENYLGTREILSGLMDDAWVATLDVESEDSPLTRPYPKTDEEFAGFTQLLREPEGYILFNYYTYRNNPSAELNEETFDTEFQETWLDRIDWNGVDTTGFWMDGIDVRNRPISGDQVSKAGSIAGLVSDGLDLQNFDAQGKWLSSTQFINASNLNMEGLLNAGHISGMNLTGAKTPDGTTITKAMFQNAMQSKWGPSGLPYPPGDYRNNFFNINSITFSE
jgi:hypothetical protein